MQFREIVPLLNTSAFQSCNVRGDNPVRWNQKTRLEQCAARTRFPLPQSSAGCRITLRAPCDVELARFRLVIVCLVSEHASPHTVARLLTMQFRGIVPLLNTPAFQSCNLRADNPVHWNQTTRLEQCERGQAFHCRNGTLVAASHCVL